MPRKSKVESVADIDAAPGGTAAVDRALSILMAFQKEESTLSLQDLSEKTRLHKSTVLRLLASLMHVQLLTRLDDGRYRMGPGVARLHAIYADSFSLEPIVKPQLQWLVEQTGESAAFHVREGDSRLCLYRVDSPHPIRDHIRAGDILPLGRGSGGHVLLAFSGANGERYDRIRQERVAALDSDRLAQLSGISCPVFDAQQQLVGAITLTMPSERVQPGFVDQVKESARTLTALLGGDWEK